MRIELGYEVRRRIIVGNKPGEDTIMSLLEPFEPERRPPSNKATDIGMRLVFILVPVLVLVALIYLLGD